LKPTRLISPPGTYFVTFCTWHHRNLFPVETNARLFLKILYHYRREGHYLLHAFVLTPDHVHLLLTPALDVTMSAPSSSSRADTRTRLELVSDENLKSGSADSRITGFATPATSSIIKNTFIKILSVRDSYWPRSNIGIAPPSPDSNLTPGPQRLKPRSSRKSQSARVKLVPFPVRLVPFPISLVPFRVRDDLICLYLPKPADCIDCREISDVEAIPCIRSLNSSAFEALSSAVS
jgi:REP element-mobilizing transposase RayT